MNVLFVLSYEKMTIAVNWTQHPNKLVNRVDLKFGKRNIVINTFHAPTLKNTRKIILNNIEIIEAQYDELFNKINQSMKIRNN